MKINLGSIKRYFIIIISSALLYGCCTFSGPSYLGEKSDHFDGEEFHNLDGESEKSLWGLLQWQLTKVEGDWPEWIDIEQGPPPPAFIGGDSLRVTFINHATVLLQTDSLNILTDPVWSDRLSPVSWAGPARRMLPGIKFEDLPRIDVVVLSHNHYDHMDLPTLKMLHETFQPHFLVPLGNKPLLEQEGISNVTEMDWWDKENIKGRLDISFVPAKHFAMRGLCDGNETLWGGYVIHSSGGPVYFAGDTGIGEHFAMIADKFGPPRLSLLPIAPIEPRWFMEPIHLSASEAVEAHLLMKSAKSIGIHFGTFKQADDDRLAPVRELKATMIEKKVRPKEFIVLFPGKSIFVDPVAASELEVYSGE